MKKKLLILAVAGLALASCSNDEVVKDLSTSDANAISFRSLVNGQTRAADITTSNLSSFKVTAFPTGTTTSPYMDDVTFTKDGSTFVSGTPYYWPASNLDFYAYSPTDGASATLATTGASGDQITKTAYNSFTVIPSSTIGSQADLVYANSNNQGKQTNGGVAGAAVINFRHAGSKIVIKVKNTAANMKFDVSAFKIVHVDGSATFTYSTVNDENTNGQNTGEAVSGTTLSTSDWTNNSDAAEKTITYSTGNFTAANIIPASQTTAMFLNHSSNAPSTENADEDINMILIPQTTSKAIAYSGTTAGDAITTGSYIAVKMIIRNNSDGTVIADATTDVATKNKWAIWPVDFSWAPGKKYIYTIDLADGGYWELNNDTDTDLDEILDGAVIKFVNVTVDEWDAMDNAIP